MVVNDKTNWTVETNCPRTPAFRVVEPLFPGSGVLNTICETDDERVACLIAAAPDMLAALEQALTHIEADETTHGRNFAAGNVIRAAIAKATLPALREGLEQQGGV